MNAEVNTDYRKRIADFLCDDLQMMANKLAELPNSAEVRLIINKYLKYGLHGSNIGEWERLVTMMFHLNAGNYSIRASGNKINLAPDLVVDILCYPYTEAILHQIPSKVFSSFLHSFIWGLPFIFAVPMMHFSRLKKKEWFFIFERAVLFYALQINEQDLRNIRSIPLFPFLHPISLEYIQFTKRVNMNFPSEGPIFDE